MHIPGKSVSRVWWLVLMLATSRVYSVTLHYAQLPVFMLSMLKASSPCNIVPERTCVWLFSFDSHDFLGPNQLTIADFSFRGSVWKIQCIGGFFIFWKFALVTSAYEMFRMCIAIIMLCVKWVLYNFRFKILISYWIYITILFGSFVVSATVNLNLVDKGGAWLTLRDKECSMSE